MAAAVADYRPSRVPAATEKRPREDGPWMLELEPTPDLLAEADAAVYIANSQGGNRIHPVRRGEFAR